MRVYEKKNLFATKKHAIYELLNVLNCVTKENREREEENFKESRNTHTHTHTHTILVEDSVHVFFLPLRERWDLFMECTKNHYSRNNEKKREKKRACFVKESSADKKNV